MRVLVNVPSLKILGGVSNHYIGLRSFWTADVRYNIIGKRSNKRGSGILWLPLDLCFFIAKIIFIRPDVVLLNPSLNKSAVTRDMLFLRISKFFRFKTAVLIHGFNWEFAKKTDWGKLTKDLNRADLILVLAEAFRQYMIERGVSVKIHLTTTKVDDHLLNNFKVEKRDGSIKNILFLARIVKEKGIYIALDAYRKLKGKYPQICLNVIGDGEELEGVRQYIMDKDIKDVKVTGAKYGKDLIKELENAQIYLFPTYYGEGMPTSVLEAMAFGMPVITRYVGGVPDFFNSQKMGFITDSLDPNDFADALIPFIENPALTKSVSLYNHEYAKDHFMASKVALSLEKELSSLI